MHFIFSSKSADPTNFVFKFWHLAGQMDRFAQYSLSTRLTWPVFCSVSTADLSRNERFYFTENLQIFSKNANILWQNDYVFYKYEINNMAKNYQYSAQTFVYQVIFVRLRKIWYRFLDFFQIFWNFINRNNILYL